MIGRLVYLTTARLPTEKAHGYQICKMCEAFAQHDVAVDLMHPDRIQPPTLRGKSVFEYYGVGQSFRVQRLPDWDVVACNRWLPNPAMAPLVFAHDTLWGRYAVGCASGRAADLYFARDYSIAYWLTRKGLPTVFEAHGVPHRGGHWLLKSLARTSAPGLVVTTTSYIREQLIELGFPADRVTVLPNGVDLSLFARDESQGACRRQLGLPEDRSIIGYVGRFQVFEMEKGIPQLIRAVAKLPPRNGRTPMLLCVGGPMGVVPSYLALAASASMHNGELRFVDRVPNWEVPLWMRACDVLTIPWAWSTYAAYITMPIKLFEYMASGVPIVASNLPSLREVLRHGDNAWLVEPGNVDALAAGLARVLSDAPLRAHMAARAGLDVRDYSWHRRASKILEYASPRMNAPSLTRSWFGGTQLW